MYVDVEVYEDGSGVRQFDALPAAYAAKVTSAVTRLGAGGRSGLKPVGQGVSEWRNDLEAGDPDLSRLRRDETDHPARRWNEGPAAG